MPKKGKRCNKTNSSLKTLNKINEVNCNVNIGIHNLHRWQVLKKKLSFQTDEEFTSFLLNLVQKRNNELQQERIKINELSTQCCFEEKEEKDIFGDEPFSQHKEEKVKTKPSVIVPNKNNLEVVKMSSKLNCISSQDCEFDKKDSDTKENDKISYICDNQINTNSEIIISCKSQNSSMLVKNDIISLCVSNDKGSQKKVKHKNFKKVKIKSMQEDCNIRFKKRKCKQILNRKLCDNVETPCTEMSKCDNTKFDQNVVNHNDNNSKIELKIMNNKMNNVGKECESFSSPQRVSITIKLCNDCDLRHIQNACPLFEPVRVISDAITTSQCQWLNKNKDSGAEEESVRLEMQPSFAEMTLPGILELKVIDKNHGPGVISKEFLPPFVKFGPLIGQPIKEVEIADDCLMRDIWEICSSSQCTYLSTQDPEYSNWLRWVRPAPIRTMRNVAVVTQDNNLIFVTVTNIEPGEELLFWAENTNTAWINKNLCKISCGGCNLRFSHTLYYRLHCTVFHDPNYSLTIRKYHCKICGLSVLGKENIMKHAADAHEGKGAYQCQFCKKFFLRLNYLEMHRTYGCSANPHRAKPLCDYCGRKFSQPQKLKVHIKRMHSDMTEVLKEFQCKRCLKLLGSRAALQRHNKEVHCKDIVRACTCDRCGKMFQNKSNLKIHMLTHSGIKPFRCAEEPCGAAFTTKQCLQFHYKKVHGLDKTRMPTIERSIAYTFDAYAGGSRPNSVNSSCSRSSFEVDNVEKIINDHPKNPPSPTLHEDVSIKSPAVDISNKIISKGSKKWMGDVTTEESGRKTNDVFEFNEEETKCNDEILNKNEVTSISFHHCKPEPSNASLLVEAALDAAEKDIDINSGPIKLPSSEPIVLANTISDSHYPTLRSHLDQSPSHNTLCRSISPSEYSVPDHNQSPHLTMDSGYPTPNSPRNSGFNLMFPDRTPHYELRFSPTAAQLESFHLDESRYDLHHRRVEENSSDESNNVAQNLSLGLKEKSIQLDLSATYKYDGLDERGGFEPLEGLDMSRSSSYHHSSFVSIPPRYPLSLYEQRPYSHADVLRVVNLTHSVDLSLPRNLHHQLVQPTNQNLVDPIRVLSPPPTYQSYPLSPSTYLSGPRSSHSPTYHHYSGY